MDLPSAAHFLDNTSSIGGQQIEACSVCHGSGARLCRRCGACSILRRSSFPPYWRRRREHRMLRRRRLLRDRRPAESVMKTLPRHSPKTPHHIVDGVDKKRGFDGKACESCHGPGAKHAGSADAKDIRNPGKLASAAIDKICLTCHVNQPPRSDDCRAATPRIRWPAPRATRFTRRSGSAGGTKNGGDQYVVRGCHVTVAGQFQKPFHHRVPEGAMSCVRLPQSARQHEAGDDPVVRRQ